MECKISIYAYKSQINFWFEVLTIDNEQLFFFP